MPSSEEQKQPAQPGPSDTPAPEASASDRVLGHINAGPRDAEPSTPEQRPPTSHRKGTGSPATGQPAPPDEDQLALPRGGLVAMRQSGGLRFRSREIVVYRSGKLAYRELASYGGAAAGAQPAGQAGHVPLSQLVELHHLLKQIDFSRLPPPGRQNPDALAYEIVARVGRSVKSAEAFEGSIPEALAPLIRELRRLMPADQ